MPLCVSILGYKTANLETTDGRDAVRRVLGDSENHTEGTLCTALQRALREHPAVTVWFATILERGTVSVFDDRQPSARLHRVSAADVRSAGVSFLAPAGEGPERFTGGLPRVDVSAVSGALIDSHPDFIEDLEDLERAASCSRAASTTSSTSTSCSASSPWWPRAPSALLRWSAGGSTWWRWGQREHTGLV